jgi:hypothetical protein
MVLKTRRHVEAPPELTRPVNMAARYPVPSLRLDSRARAVLDGLYRETCTPAENEAAALANVTSIAATIRTACNVLDETVTALNALAVELKAQVAK